MKKSNLKRMATVLICLAFSFAAIGCAGAPTGGLGDKAAEPIQDGADPQDNADNAASGQKGLPLTIESNGNSYTINSFTIEEDEDGNTNVVCKGSGFDIMPMVNNAIVIPVYCSVIEGGTETDFVSASMGGEGITFIFDKKLDPDTVVFYPEDDTSARTEVAA